jgi:two-component system chemotaxis response regulator CheB
MADLLLTSLAVTAGAHVVAVVLSGGGTHVATGSVAVHDLGGTAIAADRASSAVFGMPSAAIGRDDAVDHVLPPGEIAGLPTALLSTAPTADNQARYPALIPARPTAAPRVR